MIQSAAPESEQCCVPREWWSKWKTLSDPGKINNDVFLCRHGNLKPFDGRGLESQVKTLPKAVYTYLLGIYGGGPENFGLDWELCLECRKEEELLAARRTSEKDAVGKRDRPSLAPGEYWCLMDSQWIEKWKDYIQRETTNVPPGPISNDRLLDPKTGLPKPHLSRSTDYRGVVPAIWSYFHEIYGGGPLLARPTLDIYDPPLRTGL